MSLTSRIQALTTYANSVTGQNDTNLSDAVATLASGYGGGGGSSQGVEVITDNNGKITDYVVHGFTDVPDLLLNYISYSSAPNDVPLPVISFTDNPTILGRLALSYAKAKVDWSGLSAMEKVRGESAFALTYVAQDPMTDSVVDLPNFKGYVDGTHTAGSCFRTTSTYAPKTYRLPKMEVIPQYAWYQYAVQNIDITIGSVGHGVTSSKSRPFGGTSNATGIVTIYTTGDVLDALKTAVTENAGSGLTFIYKASEATTYNDTSYSAGDTILTSTP